MQTCSPERLTKQDQMKINGNKKIAVSERKTNTNRKERSLISFQGSILFRSDGMDVPPFRTIKTESSFAQFVVCVAYHRLG